MLILYEFVDSRGDRLLTDWPLETRQRRALNQKLDMLRKVDRNMAAGSIVFKTKAKGIYKVKVKGNVQLRPMVFFGPADDKLLTFVARATERDGDLEPTTVLDDAAATRELICAHPNAHRRPL